VDLDPSPTDVVVAVGASAGGVEALCNLVSGLPRGLPATVLVVLHVSPSSPSVLPSILGRCGLLPASHAADGEILQAGRIYVAPPDHHLLVESRRVRLWRGPRENGMRPAIDPLFRSAGAEYGSAAIGVVLSGMLDDGTAGLIELQRGGGLALVQDPNDCDFRSMPTSAARFASPDHVAPARDLAGLIQNAVARLGSTRQPSLSSSPAADAPGGDSPVAAGHNNPNPNPGGEIMSVNERSAPDPDDAPVAGVEPSRASAAEQAGTVSAFTCPDCGGTLWESHQGDFVQFRCRVGHAYGPDSLDAAQVESLEQSLWAAVVALEERADLCLNLAERMRLKGAGRAARRYELQADDARRRTKLVRQTITKLSQPVANDRAADVEEGGGEITAAHGHG
jgi:two-component system, chemotaxis family, protein-glutamate methylesterase/glutaminase